MKAAIEEIQSLRDDELIDLTTATASFPEDIKMIRETLAGQEMATGAASKSPPPSWSVRASMCASARLCVCLCFVKPGLCEAVL